MLLETNTKFKAFSILGKLRHNVGVQQSTDDKTFVQDLINLALKLSLFYSTIIAW